MRDFDGSQILYRLAYASQLRASHCHSQALASGGDIERRARSFDACIEAFVLLQASAEAWINRLYEVNGQEARGGGWRARWNGIGHIAKELGRPTKRSLSKENRALLNEIDTVRNFLLHGDVASRQRLEAWSGDRDLHGILTVDYVAKLFQRAKTLWEDAKAITGQQTPFTEGAWVAYDEVN